MSHPSESKLLDRFLVGPPDPEIDAHVESCADCRAKMERLEKARDRLFEYGASECVDEASEVLFATAWAGSRGVRQTDRSAAGWLRWGIQPATVFVAGLFLGYLLFSNGDPGAEKNRPLNGEQEVRRPTTENEKLPDAGTQNEYWEKAGFRNAKFTPKVRYEGNREIWGGTLEAETPGGAMVVMNY